MDTDFQCNVLYTRGYSLTRYSLFLVSVLRYLYPSTYIVSMDLHRLLKLTLPQLQTSYSSYMMSPDIADKKTILDVAPDRRNTPRQIRTPIYWYLPNSPTSPSAPSTQQGAQLMVYNRSWHLPGNPKDCVAPCSPYKRMGRCESVFGYQASKISLCPF